MCGILCRVKVGGEINHPPILTPLNTEGNLTKWESDDLEYILKNFIDVDLQNDLKLNISDQNKLSNLEELRSLNSQLIKLNNVIKKTDQTNAAKIEIQAKIDEIIGTELQEEHNSGTLDMFGSLMIKIASRGPDYLLYLHFKDSNNSFQFFSSILSLRQPFYSQPIQNHDLILQFNGELYNPECLHSNDTEFIMELLVKNILLFSRDEGILKTITELNGEFAFTIYDLIESKLYFGRDYIGRRSLLYNIDDSGSIEGGSDIIISSLPPSHSNNFKECISNEIKVVNLKDLTISNFYYESLWDKYGSSNKLDFSPLSSLFNFDKPVDDKLSKLFETLNDACYIRQSTIQPLHPDINEANIGILFSGGLDCTVLAALISKNLQQVPNSKIDLITVGFDNPRTNLKASESPDRQLSKKSWFHLCKLFNNDNFSIRLIEINVGYKEWLINKKRVEKLMYPCNTEMDLSIAIAFYFASKCENGLKLDLNDTSVTWEEFVLNESKYIDVQNNYTSHAKVLFSGLGADELFAGYSRHESVFNSLVKPDDSNYEEQMLAKYKELSNSLIYDIKIIHERNLGRDDRVISSWGKELRYPYLDEKLINYVINEVEPNLKLFFNWELVKTKKKGEKLVMKPIRKWLLRKLAEYMKLHWVKDELKRAIQFGAKSAKMEIGQSKVKGTDSL
ncbi:uncharacterized protein AC631_04395 [Debaryomyces fabryi]|uniref:Glutamine amidotransferase type-2 domain-containing protein n=1 Tax=Debaryomyces fabryi TaxID=58627 RepID=A0A0V1PV24_9ASCO|nr:uncharacterized protein AC631_04395 [Debaryomyces fabryi]KRZ99838.1 hypothetical protein AC631_04395 [Debaryomyces fabryi]CUM56607.1 unnamed protein product [Debaryomyces fabryi]